MRLNPRQLGRRSRPVCPRSPAFPSHRPAAPSRRAPRAPVLSRDQKPLCLPLPRLARASPEEPRRSATRCARPVRLRIEVLAGLVVALALIPEAISFSIIAGVDPRLGLFASFTMAVSIAFLGGRPAMISAATGAVALVIAPVAREYGIDYFIATVILAGVLQVLLAALGVARLMRFIPRW